MAGARIGMVVPFDMALDREYWEFVPDDASVHITRLPIIDLPYGVAHARTVAAAPHLEEAVQTLVRIEPAAIGFGCTSGSFVGGPAFDAEIRGRMEAAGASVAVTPSNALVAGLRALGVRRVGIGTPYGEPLARTLWDYLAASGFEPLSLENLEYDDEELIVSASDELVADLARRSLRPGVEALFISCTNLPTRRILGPLERELGLPVLSANQVLMWGLCRAAGIRAPVTDQALFGV